MARRADRSVAHLRDKALRELTHPQHAVDVRHVYGDSTQERCTLILHVRKPRYSRDERMEEFHVLDYRDYGWETETLRARFLTVPGGRQEAWDLYAACTRSIRYAQEMRAIRDYLRRQSYGTLLAYRTEGF